MYRLRRQIVQKPCGNPVGFQTVFVQYGGKYASKMCFKAYAVIYSKVNTYLKQVIETISENFDYVVIDGEAGIEQINRRVMENITYLILGIVILFIIRKRQEVRQ